MKTCLLRYSLSFTLIYCLAGTVWAGELRLHLPEPTWVLDTAMTTPGPRESHLSPEEQLLAAELRSLVERNKLDEALDLLASSGSSGFSAAMHYVRAQLYLSAENFAGAESSYLATLEQAPDFLRAHEGLGAVYLSQGKLDKARRHVTRAINLGASDAQVYGQLGYLNLQTQSAWSAISGYQHALFLEPDNPQWRQGLLAALVGAHQFEPARALVEEALAGDPDNASLWLQHSSLALNTNDPVAALASLEIASRMGVLDGRNTLVAAQLHLSEGNLARGLALLENNLSRFDREDADRLVQTLDWLVQRRHWSGATRVARALDSGRISLNAQHRSQVLTAWGRIHTHNGNHREAERSLEQAIGQDPANGQALLLLASAIATSEPFRAQGLFERASTLPGFEKRACLGQAQLAVDRGNYDHALELLLRARKLDPRDTLLARNISALQQVVDLQPVSE